MAVPVQWCSATVLVQMAWHGTKTFCNRNKDSLHAAHFVFNFSNFVLGPGPNSCFRDGQPCARSLNNDTTNYCHCVLSCGVGYLILKKFN